MSQERARLVENILESIRKIRHTLRFSKTQKTEMTQAQWGILHQIMHHNKQTTNDLAQELQLTKSSVSQHVNALVEKGILSRKEDPNDRRKLILIPTASFQKKAQKCNKELMKQLMEIFSVLNKKELEQFAQLHQKVTNHLKSKHEQ